MLLIQIFVFYKKNIDINYKYNNKKYVINLNKNNLLQYFLFLFN